MGATACSSDSGTSANELKASSYTKEFLYNYSQLYYLYINKDLYLGKPEDYIDKLDKEQVKLLVQNGYPWDYHDIYYMYAMMNDAFTYYIDPARSVGLMSTWSTSDPKTDAGFTLDSTVIKQKYVIKQVIKKSPADKAGLKAGDEITEIEGTPITNDIVFQRLSIASEGDTITFTLMTIDRPTYDFFRSVRSGQSGGGANPTSNITGDNCLGYFTATSITHADTLRFSYSNIRQN